MAVSNKETPIRTELLKGENLKTPVLRRVQNRLTELRKIGKADFQKNQDKVIESYEPETPICGSLELQDCVKEISKDELYEIKYSLFATETNAKGKVVVQKVPLKASPDSRHIIQWHYVIAERVIEVVAKDKPIERKFFKGDDVDAINKQFEDELRFTRPDLIEESPKKK